MQIQDKYLSAYMQGRLPQGENSEIFKHSE
jgi:hypothetical protein